MGTDEKLKADLQALLGMVGFAKHTAECRRVQLARHFGLEHTTAGSEPSDSCGACDVCASADDWLAASCTPRPAGAALSAATGEAPFQRGDWVKVDGRHLGHVVSVEGTGSRVRLVVESAGDFRRRTVNPRKQRVELLAED